jgi:hypothetical protein
MVLCRWPHPSNRETDVVRGRPEAEPASWDTPGSWLMMLATPVEATAWCIFVPLAVMCPSTLQASRT